MMVLLEDFFLITVFKPSQKTKARQSCVLRHKNGQGMNQPVVLEYCYTPTDFSKMMTNHILRILQQRGSVKETRC